MRQGREKHTFAAPGTTFFLNIISYFPISHDFSCIVDTTKEKSYKNISYTYMAGCTFEVPLLLMARPVVKSWNQLSQFSIVFNGVSISPENIFFLASFVEIKVKQGILGPGSLSWNFAFILQ